MLQTNQEEGAAFALERTALGGGFLPVPKRIRGEKSEGNKVRVAFSYVDD